MKNTHAGCPGETRLRLCVRVERLRVRGGSPSERELCVCEIREKNVCCLPVLCVCVFLSLLQLLQYDGVSINSVPVERKLVCTHIRWQPGCRAPTP